MSQIPSKVTKRKFLQIALGTGVAATLGSRLGVAAEVKNGIPYRELGATGVRVSCIGLGGFHMGVPNEKEGIALVRSALDRGINFMDNCWDYHDGVSEKRMGLALRDGYREKAFLMSKIDGQTKEAAARQIDESLSRLQTDHVDLMQFHEIIRPGDPDRIFGASGAVEAMVAAQKAGKVRFIGFTGHKHPDHHIKMLLTAAREKFHFDTVQMPLNLMDSHFESFEKKVLPWLVKNKIGVLGMKPMGGGFLLKSKAAVTADDCLNYALTLPTSVVITGCDSMAILDQAVTVAQKFKPLTETEIASLLAKTAGLADKGEFEKYKMTPHFDGTVRHPEWLG